MPYILEVHRYHENGYRYHPAWCVVEKCKKPEGCYIRPTEHIGNMNKIFATRKEACDYYNLHNLFSVQLHQFSRLVSDWDPDTGLQYLVVDYISQELNIPPFD